VAAAWALQHAAMPFLADRRYLAYRALTALPFAGVWVGVYLRGGRRLPPLVALHWSVDVVAALTAIVYARRACGGGVTVRRASGRAGVPRVRRPGLPGR